MTTVIVGTPTVATVKKTQTIHGIVYTTPVTP